MVVFWRICADGNDFVTTATRAAIFLNDGDYVEAQRQSEAALALFPGSSGVKAIKAILLARLGSAEDSMPLAKFVSVHDPFKATSWLALGEAQLAAGDGAQAVVSINKAIDLSRYNGKLYERLAIAYKAVGSENEAIKATAEAERLNSSYRQGIEKALLAQQYHLLPIIFSADTEERFKQSNATFDN
jgi:predicted Zn-dependent protease